MTGESPFHEPRFAAWCSRCARLLRFAIGGMMFELGKLDTLPVVFDEKLWHGTIDHVTVHADERVVFVFKDKAEITTTL